MKKLLLAFLLTAIVINVYSQKSHIQVVADPGISVYIDGEFKGVTNSEFGGLLFRISKRVAIQLRLKRKGSKPKAIT